MIRATDWLRAGSGSVIPVEANGIQDGKAAK